MYLFKKATLSNRVHNWVQDSIDWLEEVWGPFTGLGFGKPKFFRTVNGDSQPMLSLDCTVRHLKKQSDTVQYLLKEEFATVEAMIQERFKDFVTAREIIENYKAKDVFQMLQISAETLERKDEALRKIKNR